jgi:DNA-binding MarR family transcriptional regulator
VTLTPRGREVAEQCRAVNAQTENLLVAGIDQADVRNLHAILTRMSANLEPVTAEA